MINIGGREKLIAFAVGCLLYFANLSCCEDFSSTNRQFRAGGLLEKIIPKKEKYVFTQPTAISAKETSDKEIKGLENERTTVFNTLGISAVPTARTERKTESWTTTTSETKITSDLTSASAEDSSIKSTPTSETATETEKYETQHEFSTESEPDYSEDCGTRVVRRGRIFGGEESYPGKWPWQVLILHRDILRNSTEGKLRCGGVLITPKYVITAAHCAEIWPRSRKLVLGAHDRMEIEKYPHTVTRYVKRVIFHHKYFASESIAQMGYDLALLEMDSPVDFLPHIRPICLARSDENYSGRMAFVTGWGLRSWGYENIPRFLHEVEVPIWTEKQCKNHLWYRCPEDGKTSLCFLCAGYPGGGKSFCTGDSGGPLMVQRDDGRWELIGIVSHSFDCALPDFPGIYMSVPYFRSWIDSVIFGNTFADDEFLAGCPMKEDDLYKKYGNDYYEEEYDNDYYEEEYDNDYSTAEEDIQFVNYTTPKKDILSFNFAPMVCM